MGQNECSTNYPLIWYFLTFKCLTLQSKHFFKYKGFILWYFGCFRKKGFYFYHWMPLNPHIATMGVAIIHSTILDLTGAIVRHFSSICICPWGWDGGALCQRISQLSTRQYTNVEARAAWIADLDVQLLNWKNVWRKKSIWINLKWRSWVLSLKWKVKISPQLNSLNVRELHINHADDAFCIHRLET